MLPRVKRLPFLIATLGLFACEEARHPSPPPPPTGDAPPPPAPRTEPHLADLRQLTFGGENAEAYWSMGGEELIFQARTGDMQCDRIYRMKVADPKQVVPVSNGKGATTCSYFLPGDTDVVFASTESGGDACPPKPSMEFGYTWALYDSYEIYRAKADGTGQVRLTDSPGYDAEATVCKKDGTILFTSVRDGDIDLYRMDADGKNVKRLTTEPGYDGGAFFSDDCSQIVWRASPRASYARRSSSSTSPTPTAPIPCRSPTSTPRPSVHISSPTASASSSAPTTAIPRAASSTSG
jgi:hypothetical protein